MLIQIGSRKTSMAVNIKGLRLRSVLLRILLGSTSLLVIGVLIISSFLVTAYYYHKALTQQTYPLHFLLYQLNDNFNENDALFRLWVNDPASGDKLPDLKAADVKMQVLLKDLSPLLAHDQHKPLLTKLINEFGSLYWTEWRLLEISSVNSKNLYAGKLIGSLRRSSHEINRNIEYILLTHKAPSYAELFEIYNAIVSLQYNLLNYLYTGNKDYYSRSQYFFQYLRKIAQTNKLTDTEKNLLIKPISKLIISAHRLLESPSHQYHQIIYNELKNNYLPIWQTIHSTIHQLLSSNDRIIISQQKIIYVLIVSALVALFLGIFIFTVAGIAYTKHFKSYILDPIEYLINAMDLVSKAKGKKISQGKHQYLYEFEKLVDSFDYMVDERDQYTNSLLENKKLLERLAHYDQLTGIYNYNFFEENFKKNVKQLDLLKRDAFVIYIKILKYDEIYSMLGEALASEAIIRFAQQLSEFRHPHYLYARIGDAKFLVSLCFDRAENATDLLHEFMAHVNNSFKQSNLSKFFTYSAGVVRYSEFPNDLSKILRSCRFASMHIAKSQKLSYQLYHDDLDKQFKRESVLERDIGAAVENKQLYLVYQPQYSVNGNHLIGCEVLMRWNHPEFGAISPDEFIPLAEKTGDIVPFAEFMKATALEAFCDWRRDANGDFKFKMALNMSLYELLASNYVVDLLGLLHSYDIDCSNIEVEITETLLAVSLDEVKNVINQLRSNGITIAIDDFGTGYSSLHRLLSFGFDLLKIDKSFIEKANYEKRSENLLGSVINLAKSIDIETIAEGVETKDQFECVKALGCDYIQGYYFSKPVTADKMKALLAK